MMLATGGHGKKKDVAVDDPPAELSAPRRLQGREAATLAGSRARLPCNVAQPSPLPPTGPRLSPMRRTAHSKGGRHYGLRASRAGEVGN